MRYAILFSLLFGNLALAGAETKGTVKGANYLEMFASICDDHSWQAIEKFSKKSGFAEAEFPIRSVRAGYNSVESEADQAKLVFLPGSTEFHLGQTVVKGDPCTIATQIVSASGNPTNSAFLAFLIPEVYASPAKQDPTHPTVQRTAVQNLGVFAALMGTTTLMGCAVGAQAGIIGGPAAPVTVPAGAVTGCVSGAAVGALLGSVKIIADVFDRSSDSKQMQTELSNFVKSGALQFKSCSKDQTQVVNGSRIVTLNRGSHGTEVEFRNKGELVYRDNLKIGSAAAIFNSCRSVVQRDSLNSAIKSSLELARGRLVASSNVTPPAPKGAQGVK